MNLAELRSAMYSQADWSPDQSSQATGRVNGFINRAYNQLALEAPFLFFEKRLVVATEPDVESASDSDTLQLLGNNALSTESTDPWTFVTTYTNTTAQVSPDSYTTSWAKDRSWDGRDIYIKLADGTFIRNKIRSIWYDAADDKFKLTMLHPWNKSAHGAGSPSAGFKFHIYTEAYPFPDDIIKMRSMRLFNNTQQYPLDVMGQDDAEGLTLVGPRAQVAAGIPRVAFRREHFQLDGPGLAPRVSKAKNYDWKGPEHPGEFEYVVTYTWGKRDAEFRLPGLPKWDTYAGQWNNTGQTITIAPNDEVANNRIREPRYESAPSPVSTKIEPVLNDDQVGPVYAAIGVTVPNIEYVLGFLTEHFSVDSAGDTGKRVSQHQSGIHVRIYRRRLKDIKMDAAAIYRDLDYDSKGIYAGNYAFADNKQKFYLLAELRVDELNQGRFIDDGQCLPDRLRPLRDVHGYQQYALYPRPDARYEIDVRCVRRPQKLDDEYDVPQVHAEATNVLLTRAMSYLYESMGNLEASQLMLARYQAELLTLSKRYGDLRPSAVPVHRRMVRARYSARGRDGYRKWYTSNS